MGYRTTVILFNDQCSSWEKDPELGKKIARGMNYVNDDKRGLADLGYGRVVECCHADQQTLAVLDTYCMDAVAHSTWRHGDTAEARNLRLLKDLAARLGYRIARKPTKEPQP